MTYRKQDAQAIVQSAKQLGVDPGSLAGLFELESGGDPNIWGGEGGKYRGLIQFGPDARREVGLPNKSMSVTEQLPYVERYLRQRGFQPGKMGAKELYRTVLVGNPFQGGTDSFGTNSDKAAARMAPGGDLYKRGLGRIQSGLGSSLSPTATSEVSSSSRPMDFMGQQVSAPMEESVRPPMAGDIFSAPAGEESGQMSPHLAAATDAMMKALDMSSTPTPANDAAIGVSTALAGSEVPAGISGAPTVKVGDVVDRAGRSSLGLNKGVGEACAISAATILNKMGRNVPVPSGKSWDGLSTGGALASRFFNDQVATKIPISQVQPGDPIAFANTYGNWGPGTITHVGVAAGKDPNTGQLMMYDHSSRSGVVKRPVSTFAQPLYAARLRD